MKIGEVINKLLGDIDQKVLILFVHGEYNNSIKTNFSRWLKGQGEYPSKYLLKTAEFLNISIVDLLAYDKYSKKELEDIKKKMFDLDNPLKKEMEELPFYIKDSFPFMANDASMSPYIESDDCCIFQRTNLKEIKDGEVVFFRYEDKEGIRIFKEKENGKYLLRALNGVYEDIEVKSKRKLKIARLFKIIREPKIF